MRHPAYLTTLLAAGLAAAPLGAQAPPAPAGNPSSEEEQLLELLNTPVSSASLIAQKAIEAPGVIEVVIRDQIQAYGWNSLNDVLYRQPGFAPSMDFNHRTVSSRGMFESFANNHLLYLVDGVPMNDPLYGTAWTWDVTPIFMAKSLEVLRGPGSALYGSNATAGVVHMKTVSPQDLPTGAEATLRLGSRGEQCLDALVARQGSRFAATLGFSTYQTEGNAYPSYDGNLVQGGFLKQPTWDQRKAEYLWAKIEGAEDLKGLTFQYHFQHFNWEFGQGNIMFRNNLKENLDEGRHSLSVSYQSAVGQNVEQNTLVRYQKRPFAWFTQEFPNGTNAGGVDYPNGLWESVDTTVSEWLARTQWSFRTGGDSSLLLGLEGSRFLYRGDRAHFSNVDIRSVGGSFLPFQDNQFQAVGPFLEWILDKPVLNVAFYGQYTSPKFLDGTVQATLGLRSDRTSFEYVDLTGDRTTRSLSYANVSPRAALVWMPSPGFSIKAMTGKAFRAPAPIEFGVANSYFTLSNIKELQPETLKTHELAFDWIINRNLNWRTNAYDTRFEGLIGYDSLSRYVNLFTLSTRGFETELIFGFGSLTGFVNYAFAQRYDEAIKDPGITVSRNRMTWYPSASFNGGITYRPGKWIIGLSGRRQGPVDRRDSEVGLQQIPYYPSPSYPAVNLDQFRPRTLSAWTVVDVKVSCAISRYITASVQANNLFDHQELALVKTFAFPFDFRMEGRRITAMAKVQW